MRRHERTDDQWERLAPFRPPQRPATGRPAKDQRTLLKGILWVRKTGAPWRDLPERYGPWRTGSSRFRRWPQASIWDTVLRGLQAEAAHEGTLDGARALIKGRSIRAHHHAAGARKGGTHRTKGSAGAAAAWGANST